MFTQSFSSLARFAAVVVLGGMLAGCAGLAQAFPAPAKAQGLSAQGRGTAATADDAVRRAILAGAQPPKTIYEVRQRLLAQGGKLATHIVANRGHENPEGGSFSFFETYTGPMAGGTVKPGELYIGFFTERKADTLVVQQSFDPGLMIEIIAWDYTKQMYNFWELIGDGKGSGWHYRGDSNDVLADGARVNMGEGRPAFGTKLRCAGCHTLGGPIMKELATPNNDWWTDAHKLELGSLKLQAGTEPTNGAHVAAGLFKGAQDAGRLSSEVKLGIDKLLAARARRNGDGQTLKQELRSLVTPMEMNLASDRTPFRQAAATVALPQGFFVDERLSGAKSPVAVATSLYTSALGKVGSRFAADEASGLAETRHAFVVPVRSYIDNRVIDGLIQRGLLDEELVADILAVDLTTPLYSKARAGLIRFFPESARDSADLKAKLVAALQKTSADAGARELLANITDPARTAAAHRKRAIAFLGACEKARTSPESVTDWLRIASQRRAEVAASEPSQNPKGTILEPGFRVIFPTDSLSSRPGKLMVDEKTCRCSESD